MRKFLAFAIAAALAATPAYAGNGHGKGNGGKGKGKSRGESPPDHPGAYSGQFTGHNKQGEDVSGAFTGTLDSDGNFRGNWGPVSPDGQASSYDLNGRVTTKGKFKGKADTDNGATKIRGSWGQITTGSVGQPCECGNTLSGTWKAKGVKGTWDAGNELHEP